VLVTVAVKFGRHFYFDYNIISYKGMNATGEKAIGTGWTVATPEEEESNWGGTILSM